MTYKRKNQSDISIGILDKLTGVHLEMARWSGFIRVVDKAKPGHFKEVQIWPKEEMKFFFRIRHAVFDRWLERVGIICMGHHLISADLVEKTHNYFSGYKDDYMAHVEDIRGKYDDHISRWCKKEPGLSHLMNTPQFSKDNILKKFSFKWNFFNLAPVKSPLLQKDFFGTINQLDQILFTEISCEANVLWERIFSVRRKITPRVAGPIKFLKNKLEGLAFLNPQIESSIKIIEAATLEIPTQQNNDALPAKLHEKLKNLIWIFKDPELLQSYSQMVYDGASPLSVLAKAGAQRLLPENQMVLGTI